MALDCTLFLDTDLSLDQVLTALRALPGVVTYQDGLLDPALTIHAAPCDDELREIGQRWFGFTPTVELSLRVRKDGALDEVEERLVHIWGRVLALPVRAMGAMYDFRKLLLLRDGMLRLERDDTFWTPALRALLGHAHQMEALPQDEP